MVDAGWYSDSSVPGRVRWWDGERWTDEFRDAAAAASPADHGPATATPALASYATYRGDKVVVPAWAVTSGLAPARCRLHRKAGATRRVGFRSKPPWWVFLLIPPAVLATAYLPPWGFLTLLLPPLAHMAVRTTLVAEDWTCCSSCLRERRVGIAVIALTLLVWPVLWFWTVGNDALTRSTVLDGMVLLAVVLVPVGLVLGFGYRISQMRMVGGTLSADGSVLSLPADSFPPPVTQGSAGAPRAAGGQTFLPQW